MGKQASAMSSNRAYSGGQRRGQTQRIASGARTAPYSRPETSRTQSADDRQWPPTQLSIRGSSGPTYIIVGNLLKGTTQEDIYETFQQFGQIDDIVQRKPPSDNYPSIAFEIGFNSRLSASTAIEKLDGALADGRILTVTYREASKFTPSTNAAPVSIPRAHTPPAVVANQRELIPSIPSGPRAQKQQQPPARNGRELLGAKPQQAKATPAASLQSRMMTAAELKTLQKQQARAAPASKSIPGVPKGPKGTASTSVTAAAVPLAKRITLPLAMRLSAEAKMNGPASSLATVAANKKRKARGKGRAKGVNGMDVD